MIKLNSNNYIKSYTYKKYILVHIKLLCYIGKDQLQ
jgi:hypothetical protein